MPHPDSAPTPTISATRWFAMIPMMLGVLIGSVTISSVTTALPAMRDDIGMTAAEGVWFLDVYPLALAATLVIAARAGDQFGRRTIMVIGLAGFAVLNLAAGFASDPLLLILTRVALGTSEAMVIASVVATIGSQFLPRERVLAYGLWTAAFGSGSAFGPVAGGLLASGPGWRWIMWGCVPLAIIALLLALWLVPNSRTSQKPHWDPISIATSILGLAGIVYALQHAASDTAPAIVVGIIGIGATVWFTRRQRRLADPLIDVGLFRNRHFAVAVIRILVVTGATAAAVYLVSVHLQESRGDSALAAGLAVLPLAAAIMVGGVLAPLGLRRMTNQSLVVATMLIQAAGLIWIAFDPVLFAVPLVLVGLGSGVVSTLAATALFDVTTADQAGQVGAIQEVGFALGNGLGVAILGTVALAVVGAGFTVALWVGGIAVAAAALFPLLGTRRSTLP